MFLIVLWKGLEGGGVGLGNIFWKGNVFDLNIYILWMCLNYGL